MFLQKHSVPKDLGNNYAVNKNRQTHVRYSNKELFISIVPVRNVSKKKKFFCQISSRCSGVGSRKTIQFRADFQEVNL